MSVEPMRVTGREQEFACAVSLGQLRGGGRRRGGGLRNGRGCVAAARTAGGGGGRGVTLEQNWRYGGGFFGLCAPAGRFDGLRLFWIAWFHDLGELKVIDTVTAKRGRATA